MTAAITESNGNYNFEGMFQKSALEQCRLELRTLCSKGAWKRIKWMNCRVSHKECYQPTPIEHIANILTHGLWVVPSFLSIFQMLTRSHSAAQVISALVYGTTLVLVFSISTSFHCTCFHNKHGMWRDILHRCDRAMIHIFIAGSYFPWLTLEKFSHNTWASTMKWYIWFPALGGIFYQHIFHERYKSIETMIYLINGIGPAVLILMEHNMSGFVDLSIGGFFYVAGLMFFKSDGLIPCAHAIWHIFVVIAAGIHYHAILKYLYPLDYNHIAQFG